MYVLLSLGITCVLSQSDSTWGGWFSNKAAAVGSSLYNGASYVGQGLYNGAAKVGSAVYEVGRGADIAVSAGYNYATKGNPGNVCGHYCGPGWCAGINVGEATCTAGSLDRRPPQKGNCADRCCQLHDRCCSGRDIRRCNRALLACLNSRCATIAGDACALSVFTAMNLVLDNCCGSSCSSFPNGMGPTPKSRVAQWFAARRARSPNSPALKNPRILKRVQNERQLPRYPRKQQ